MKIKIERIAIEGTQTIFMNKNKNVLTFDGQPCEYEISRFIFKVTDMVSDWPNKLDNSSVADGLTYKIIIKDQDEKRFEFKNKFPHDIYRLSNLIDDVQATVTLNELA